ncbi:MAG: prolipoprotein diacylglyceryl transferase [Pseudomonadota bacterium]|nr:prolipoprotein diacylglyceryl transferase [Pseudomonadota bacterium]
MLPVIAFPAIDPIALQLGPLAIRWYALAYIAGILLGWRYASWLAGRRGAAIPPQAFDDFVMWATLGIILGGRLGYVFFYKPFYFLANPAEIIMVWQGGMAFHGGLLGVVAATWWFTRRRGLSFLSLADLVCAAAPIGLFFGRIANFINGELWGRPSEVAWAMVFPHAGQLPRHPSQLYEAALEGLLLFAVLAALARRDAILARPGLLSGVFFLGYGLTRSAAEFFREPDAHLGFLMGGATMGQILSIPMILFGAALIRHAQRQPTTHG